MQSCGLGLEGVGSTRVAYKKVLPQPPTFYKGTGMVRALGSEGPCTYTELYSRKEQSIYILHIYIYTHTHNAEYDLLATWTLRVC